MRKPFILEYWMDDDWYVGRLKEVPGVFSQGETLEEIYEPYLIQEGLLQRTPRGRVATELAYRHFGILKPKLFQQKLF